MAVAVAEERPVVAQRHLSRDPLIWIGVVSGIFIGLALMADARPNVEELLLRIDIGGAVMVVLMAGWSRSADWIAKALRFSPQQSSRYFRHDTLAGTTALLTIFFALGATFGAPQIACLVLLMFTARAAALWLVLAPKQRDELLASNGWLAFLFLISGFAALIYQIVWQRALFAAFGVNIESITIIVSLFM